LTVKTRPEKKERIRVLLGELENQIAQLENEIELYRKKVRRALLAWDEGGNE
jgi:hypothetical protein